MMKFHKSCNLFSPFRIAVKAISSREYFINRRNCWNFHALLQATDVVAFASSRSSFRSSHFSQCCEFNFIHLGGYAANESKVSSERKSKCTFDCSRACSKLTTTEWVQRFSFFQFVKKKQKHKRQQQSRENGKFNLNKHGGQTLVDHEPKKTTLSYSQLCNIHHFFQHFN